MINQRYKIIAKIGEGGFAKLFLAQDTKMDILVALKRYDPDKLIAKIESQSTGAKVNANKYSVLSEIKRGIGLTHNNLIRYYDAFDYTEQSSFGEEKYEVGIMEYLKDGDWGDFIEKYKPNSPEFKSAVIGVLNGLDFLHSHKIIHRDIKPTNILFNGLTPKITDLGISKDVSLSTGESSVLLGTVEYMSPEQISPYDFGIDNKISYNTDFWSLGIILYKSFLNKLPFGSTSTGIDSEEVRKNILSESHIIKDLDEIAHPYNTIIKRCLVRKASDRIKSVDEILKILNSKEIIKKKHDGNSDNKNGRKGEFKEKETDIINVKSNKKKDSNNENGKLESEKEIINYKKYLLYAVIAFVFSITLFFVVPLLNNNSQKNILVKKETKHTKKEDETKNTYNIEKERKLLSKYFDEIFDVNNDSQSNFKFYNYRKNDINKLFTKDAKIKVINGSLYSVNDFFINYITTQSKVNSFKIAGHQDGKIYYLKIN